MNKKLGFDISSPRVYFQVFVALLVGPGLLPYLFDLLVTTGRISVIDSVNPKIFAFILILEYFVCVPSFALLFILKRRAHWFPIAGALLSLIAFWILPDVITPAITREDEEIAKRIFLFCAPYVLLFGGFAGALLAVAISFQGSVGNVLKKD